MNLHKMDSDDEFRQFKEEENEGGSEYSVDPSDMTTPRQQEPT